MASSLISTPSPTTNSQSRDSRVHNSITKKKKPHSKHHHHPHPHHHQHQNQQQSQIKWKSQAQQSLYSSRLRQALAGAGGGGKAVRETADRVLATAARGRTRWSRAILTSRLKLKFRKAKNHNKRQRLVSPSVQIGPVRSRKSRFSVLRLKGKTVPAVQRKARVLGRLVPGCRKEPLPVILEEAMDYIPALEMQVRAMAALADLLLGSSSSSGAADAPPS